jgi:hypothetical protein
VETVFKEIAGSVYLPLTQREIRDRTRLHNDKVGDCIRRLMEAKRIESLEVTRPRGKKGEQKVNGYRLPKDETSLMDG